MFWKKKNQPNQQISPKELKKLIKEKKKKGMLDKLVMKAIIGGAIGSVIGLSMAPKTGKETREYLIEKGGVAKTKGIKIFERIKNFFKKG